MSGKTSPAAQDYLKGIYMLETAGRPREDCPGAGKPVSTAAIAARLNVSAASATNMVKRLDSMGLVEQVAYHGATLTPAGRNIALEVIRHHRLLETYLAEALGVPWDKVHQEAEVLEHVLSEDLEDRIASLLGDPALDPHGHPIPAKDGTVAAASERRLWDAAAGDRVSVERVSDEEAATLRYLADLGIKPDTRLEIVRREPVGGPLVVRIADAGSGEVCSLWRELAESVWVS